MSHTSRSLSRTLLAGAWIPTLFLLTGISECDSTDADDDGYDTPEDCNDTRPDVYPGAPEVCDGIDQDCDGLVDDGFNAGPWYPDADGDGFGDARTPYNTCLPPTGTVLSDADCNDANATRYPGALDTVGDGVDADCGGTDAPEPSVGLETSTFTTIQAALDAAPDNPAITVWVGPGTYLGVKVTFRGKALRLKGTHGRSETVIDGQQQGTVFYFTDNEGPQSVLEGFTITGGISLLNCDVYADWSICDYLGGGILVDSASPTFKRLTLTGNTADYGAGMFVAYGSPSLSQISFFQNQADTQGGGLLAFQTANMKAEDCDFTENSAEYEGGIAILEGEVALTRVLITRNIAGNIGGGIKLKESSSVLTQVTITDNVAADSVGGVEISSHSTVALHQVVISGNISGSSGGGIRISDSAPNLSHVEISGNTAAIGGGISAFKSSPTLTHVRITGNTASGEGGGLSVSDSSISVRQTVLSGNSAKDGGGIWLENSSLLLEQSIVAYNQGRNLFRYAKNGNPSSVTASASNLYNPTAFGTDNLTPTGTYTTLEPQFLVYRDSAGTECAAGSSDTCLPSDLHLSVTSPLVNAGSSAISDLDGSRSDLGIYGGALGGSWDRDQDGAFDWFWPGEHSAAPSGFSPGAYDQDDANALIK